MAIRHVILTCKHHPELRWSCKSIAFSPGYGYNQSRSIFFNGKCDVNEYPTVKECDCSPRDLILAPEEIERQKTEPTYDTNGRDLD